MSLIKEALDKAQQEGEQPEEAPEPGDEQVPDDPETPADQTGEKNPDSREISLSVILASVAIVILAALIGGQLVLLLSMAIR